MLLKKLTFSCVPSNCTPELQPLNKQLDDLWDKAVLNYRTAEGVKMITQVKFASLFSEV
jgi:hypothetical protein